MTGTQFLYEKWPWSSSKQWLVLGLEQKIYKVKQEHLVVPVKQGNARQSKSKLTGKLHTPHSNGDEFKEQGSQLGKSSQWPKLEQFEPQNA